VRFAEIPINGWSCQPDAHAVAFIRLNYCGNNISAVDFSFISMASNAHVMALAAFDSWLDKDATNLLLAPTGRGKIPLEVPSDKH
jgi:hypothetical protein